MSESTGFTIAPLRENDYDEAMRLIRRTFYIDEPLNKTIGLCKTKDDLCPELEEFCSSSFHEGLSFKAVDEEGNIIGVLVNETCPITEDIGTTFLRKAEASADVKFKKILYILAKREEGSRLWEKFPEEKTLVEVKVAATDQKWRQRGVMNALVKETEKFLKERGVRLMRLDTSSAFSAKSAERMGFTCLYKTLYRDIKKDGEPLIVPELPHEYDCVFIKKLF